MSANRLTDGLEETRQWIEEIKESSRNGKGKRNSNHCRNLQTGGKERGEESMMSGKRRAWVALGIIVWVGAACIFVYFGRSCVSCADVSNAAHDTQTVKVGFYLLLRSDCAADESALYWAASYGDLTSVRLLVAFGAALDGTNLDGDTALHAAAEWGHAEVFKYLMQKGADITVRNDRGHTPLHMAAFRGKTEILNYILGGYVSLPEKADVNSQDEKGNTPLHIACATGHDAVATKLLEMGADVTARNDAGRTALHGAAAAASPGCVTLLLVNGADPSREDAKGLSPLDLARQKRDEHIESGQRWGELADYLNRIRGVIKLLQGWEDCEKPEVERTTRGGKKGTPLRGGVTRTTVQRERNGKACTVDGV